jgi:hypothetical protein
MTTTPMITSWEESSSCKEVVQDSYKLLVQHSPAAAEVSLEKVCADIRNWVRFMDHQNELFY